MRLFYAIAVPPEIVEQIVPLQAKLEHTRADVAWVPPDKYHITVKFVGEASQDIAGELSHRLDTVAEQVNAFDLEVEGIDRFPERGPPRVIISRILNPDNRLVKLHRLIDSSVGGIGLAMDTRVLVPHLTLGRVRSNHGVNRLVRLIEKHDTDFFGRFTVNEVMLMRSDLGRGAGGSSRYTVLHQAALAPLPIPSKVT